MLSACVLSRNSKREDLTALAESLHSQDLDFNQWELILIDNNSSFNLEQHHGDLFAWHPNLRFAMEPKPGFPCVHNRCILESRARLILILADDLTLPPGYLRKGLAIMEEHQDVGVLTATTHFKAPPGLPETSRKLHDRLYDFPHFKGVFKTKDMSGYSAVFKGSAGTFVRRPVAEQYGKAFNVYELLMEKLKEHKVRGGLRVTDIDLHLHAMKLGYHSMTTDELTLEHFMTKEELDAAIMLPTLQDIYLCEQVFRLRWGWDGYPYSTAQVLFNIAKAFVLSRLSPAKRADALIDLHFFLAIRQFRRFLRQNPGIADKVRLA